MRQRASGVPARPVAALVLLIRQELAAGADHYRAAGTLLLEAKSRLKHGQFKPWIKGHLRLSYRTAADYMRLADAKMQHAASLREANRIPSTRRIDRHPAPPRTVDDDKDAIRDMAFVLIDAGHRALAVKHHPDKVGGSVTAMTRLNRARTVLAQYLQTW